MADQAPEMDARERLIALVESDAFRAVVMVLIVLNAITLGLETYPGVVKAIGPWLSWFDRIVITVFVFEIMLKLFAYRARFFTDGWHVFDLLVVLISVAPNAGPFSVLRALRVMRLFHVMSVAPQLRRVVEALFRALPGMSGIVVVLGLIFYVASVMATKLFHQAEATGKFATLGDSALTLFQVMTLEGWSEEVMRPVLVDYPWAWVFFLVFITLTSFAVLNLFIAVIVDSLQKEAFVQDEVRDELASNEAETRHRELTRMIGELRAEVAALKADRREE